MSAHIVIDFTERDDGTGWIYQLLRDGMLAEFSESAHCDPQVAQLLESAVVIDDGSDAGIAAMKTALHLRHLNPALRIAVCKPIDRRWSDMEAQTFGVSERVFSACESRVSMLQVRALLSADHCSAEGFGAAPAITFEYQGC